MRVVCIDFTSEFYLKSQKLRNQVLREPLGQNLFDEDLSDEINQFHFVALEKAEVLGVVVLVPHYKNGMGKLRQMATSEEVRGRGYGIMLVNALELFAGEHGMTSIILHARHTAIGFYEKLGYKITSDIFQEVGIEHVVMEKEIGFISYK
ncbi:MAG: GNAT family N-acetyltransferase [Bacteroidetes bacterium]|nr:GNAT family N-acetyltransferase [Bacteroidota bacterium]